MAVYRIEFEVIGHFPFPLDMLRYDNCHPERSEDASHIRDSLIIPDSREVRTVRLCQFSDVKGGRVTDDRWRSFGWVVTRDVHFESRKWPS